MDKHHTRPCLAQHKVVNLHRTFMNVELQITIRIDNVKIVDAQTREDLTTIDDFQGEFVDTRIIQMKLAMTVVPQSCPVALRSWPT